MAKGPTTSLAASFFRAAKTRTIGTSSITHWWWLMTAQVSDVQITSKTIRRLTTLHGAISFFFNATVLALTVNIVSSLMQPDR
jgi:hypothetical protein